METIFHNEAEMGIFARTYLSNIASSPMHATIIGLSGNLGSGKTTFTKALARELGITEEVQSPTFVIAKYYSLTNQKWDELVHIDAYRIEHPNEIAVLRWGELTSHPRKLIVIEWPEQLKENYPSFASTLVFTAKDQYTRTIITPQ